VAPASPDGAWRGGVGLRALDHLTAADRSCILLTLLPWWVLTEPDAGSRPEARQRAVCMRGLWKP